MYKYWVETNQQSAEFNLILTDLNTMLVSGKCLINMVIRKIIMFLLFKLGSSLHKNGDMFALYSNTLVNHFVKHLLFSCITKLQSCTLVEVALFRSLIYKEICKCQHCFQRLYFILTSADYSMPEYM